MVDPSPLFFALSHRCCHLDAHALPLAPSLSARGRITKQKDGERSEREAQLGVRRGDRSSCLCISLSPSSFFFAVVTKGSSVSESYLLTYLVLLSLLRPPYTSD